MAQRFRKRLGGNAARDGFAGECMPQVVKAVFKTEALHNAREAMFYGGVRYAVPDLIRKHKVKRVAPYRPRFQLAFKLLLAHGFENVHNGGGNLEGAGFAVLCWA